MAIQQPKHKTIGQWKLSIWKLSKFKFGWRPQKWDAGSVAVGWRLVTYFRRHYSD